MLKKLRDSLAKFAKLGVADKGAVEELIRDMQRILIQSDVDVKLVFELSKNMKEKALAEKIPPGLSRREHVIDIVYKELVKFLGEKKAEINLGKQKILLVGLFGSGKTTVTAKLAKFYLKRGLKVGIIGCDIWRPAALEQLQQLGKKINVDVYGEKKEKNPEKILKNGLNKLKGRDILIIDSAGRSALDRQLSKELYKINKIAKADEKILVLSGDIGQAAKKQADEFNKLVGLTGVVVTKMDSSAKGGGALSSCHATGVNVKFIGTGEKMDDLEIYDPLRYTSRLLGMGDLESLIEKAKETIKPEKAKDMMKGDFTLEDFCGQIESVKKMGSMSKIMEMIPGLGGMKLPEGSLDVQEEKMQKWKYIVNSMTKKEKQDVDIIDKSRVERIAKGSGTKPEEVRELIKNYRKIKRMIKKFKGGKAFKPKQMAKLMKGFKGFAGF